MSVANIRKDINQSQREGKLFYSSFYFVSHGFILGVHSAPPGRVVGMLNTGGPFIPPHQSYQAYFSGRTAAMLPPPVPTTGYSAVHSLYHEARKDWSALASRGPSTNILASGMLMLAFTASYETFSGKGKSKCGFETIPVS